jgi:hypothetical protein
MLPLQIGVTPYYPPCAIQLPPERRKAYARPLAGAHLENWHRQLAVLRGDAPGERAPAYVESVRLLRAVLAQRE